MGEGSGTAGMLLGGSAGSARVIKTLAKRESNYFTGITPACEALEVIRRNCAINRFHCEGACESDRAPLRLFGGLGGVNYFSILMEAALSV